MKLRGIKMLFSDKLIETIQARIEDRVISVQNYIERKHPILPHYKADDSNALAKTLINILLTLSDEQKQEVINTLESMKSKG